MGFIVLVMVLPNPCMVFQIDHKRLKLKELAVYCLPDSRSLAPVTPATTVGADGRRRHVLCTLDFVGDTHIYAWVIVFDL